MIMKTGQDLSANARVQNHNILANLANIASRVVNELTGVSMSAQSDIDPVDTFVVKLNAELEGRKDVK